MAIYFNKAEKKKLKQLNSKDNLGVMERIQKAELSKKLQEVHYKRATLRLHRAKKLIPYSLGLKIIKCLHVKSYKELLTNYYVVNKKNASRFATNNNKQTSRNDASHNI